MTDTELKDIDIEDIEDLLSKVETSFDIKFDDNELIHIKNFGQLSDHIADKIKLANSDDCTTQQAFNKLRRALSLTLRVDAKSITPDSLLADLLPRQSRRSPTKSIERNLGFKLNLLRPPRWVTGTLLVILLLSIVSLFFAWQIGLIGVISSMVVLRLSFINGNELDVKTVGQLAKKMTRDNYVSSRRNPKSFNKSEVVNVLTDLFSVELNINKSKLTRNATFSE